MSGICNEARKQTSATVQRVHECNWRRHTVAENIWLQLLAHCFLFEVVSLAKTSAMVELLLNLHIASATHNGMYVRSLQRMPLRTSIRLSEH